MEKTKYLIEKTKIKSILLLSFMGSQFIPLQSQALDNNNLGFLAAMMAAKSMSSQNSPFPLYEAFTDSAQELSAEPFTLDNIFLKKSYKRGRGDNQSVVTLSLETTVLENGRFSSDFYPTLEQFDKIKPVMDLLLQEFKDKYLIEEYARPPLLTVEEKRALEFLDTSINNDTKSSSLLTKEDHQNIEKCKTNLTNKAHIIYITLSDILKNDDFETSITLSYYDLSRELKLTLKTDKSPEAIAKIPPNYSEQVCTDPLRFFDNLGKWLESTLEMKLKKHNLPSNINNNDRKNNDSNNTNHLSMYG